MLPLTLLKPRIYFRMEQVAKLVTALGNQESITMEELSLVQPMAQAQGVQSYCELLQEQWSGTPTIPLLPLSAENIILMNVELSR